MSSNSGDERKLTATSNESTSSIEKTKSPEDNVPTEYKVFDLLFKNCLFLISRTDRNPGFFT